MHREKILRRKYLEGKKKRIEKIESHKRRIYVIINSLCELKL